MAPRLLLVATTSWPTAARLAAAFTKLSWHVEAMAPAGALVRSSRFAETVHRYAALAPMGSLQSAIACAGADLVIPCDDRAVSLLLKLHAEVTRPGNRDLAGLIARSLGAPEHYETMMTRPAFLAAAEALDIAVPRTLAIASEDEFETGLAEIGLPVVIKADGSWGGAGVAVAFSREEARAAYRRLSEPVSAARSVLRAVRRHDAHHLAAAFAPVRPRLSLQAFISGTPATTSFACWEGEVLSALHFDVVASDGNTGPASVVRRTEDPQMAEAARRLARRFRLSGLHGLDFIRDASGAVHLLEINPRATQTAALALGEGCDLVAALTARATGARTAPRTQAIENDLIALFPQEWRRDPASPHLAAAHHDVPWDDPALLRACLAEPSRFPFRPWLTKERQAMELASLPPGNHPALASER